MPAPRSFILCALLLSALLAGCTDPGVRRAPDPASTFEYLVRENDVVVGKAVWTISPSLMTIRTSRMGIMDAAPVGIRLDGEEGETVASSVFFVAPTSRTEEVIVNGCTLDHGALRCDDPEVTAEWGSADSAVALFGSLMLGEVPLVAGEGADVAVGTTTRRLLVEPASSGVLRLRPAEPGARSAEFCNALDDEVLYDIEARLVRRCSHGASGVSFELASGGTVPRLPPGGAARGEVSLGPLAARSGRLPPGSDVELWPGLFTLAAAEAAALRASPGLKGFVSSHPGANFEEATYLGTSRSSSAGGVSVETQGWRLRYLAEGGAGFETTIERAVTRLGESELRREETARDDPAWRPPAEHRLPKIVPPPHRMVGIADATSGIDSLPFLPDVVSFSLHNDMDRERGQVRYRYYYSLARDCPGDGCVLPYVVVDPVDGQVISGQVPLPAIVLTGG